MRALYSKGSFLGESGSPETTPVATWLTPEAAPPAPAGTSRNLCWQFETKIGWSAAGASRLVFWAGGKIQ